MATYRQNQTHYQEYLRKVAAEGFADVDKFHGRGIARIFHPPPPLPPQVVVKVGEPVMCSNDVAQRFGGILIPPPRPPPPQVVVKVGEPVMYSNHVAQRFGGILIPARRGIFN
ncbi:hypothetical protein Dsin_028847 [Dipteronia sinensis]|uniref:Uncharacterized protein n=1 Tax=Dipteronia sinensis TaxID=43782 RepID=A0AAD9ZSU7_9ROSI|nr:hypothetical protein Dsin_028847 [Dipteronia sinensis]